MRTSREPLCDSPAARRDGIESGSPIAKKTASRLGRGQRLLAFKIAPLSRSTLHFMKSSLFAAAILAAVVFTSALRISAQASPSIEALALHQTVTRDIAPGSPQLFSLHLNPADYVDAEITQQGQVSIVVYLPDSSVLRTFPASDSDGKQSFAFAAEGGGDYKLEITAGDKPAHYELRIDAITGLDERLKPEPWSDPNPSTRIQRLRTQIAAGQTNTESFWNKVTAERTPLVEPFASDGKYQLVTFLWRSTYDTRNVFVRGSFLGVGAPSDYSMHRIPNSDVWYLTLKLPSGARFVYQLSPNDPLTFTGPRAAQRTATRQADPLNPHRSDCPPNASKFDCDSVAELPGAPPQPWLVVKPEIAEGHVEKQTIKSAIEKMERPFSVYTPANYKSDGPPNALVIFFDGEDLAEDPYPLTTLNNLIAAAKIPPTVAVFVENVPHRRLVDLVANPEFADFMATELVPWVRSHYNVTKDQKQTVLTGYSAGGLASAYVAFRHSEVFGNVLSLSGAFWWSFEHNGGVCGPRCPDSGGTGGKDDDDATTEGNFMVKQFLASPKLPLRFYFAAGTFEIDRNGGGDILECTRDLRDVLLAKGYEVHYEQFAGGHDGLSWRGMFADGLLALIGTR
jgi:enterochelin esterase-like enzyme